MFINWKINLICTNVFIPGLVKLSACQICGVFYIKKFQIWSTLRPRADVNKRYTMIAVFGYAATLLVSTFACCVVDIYYRSTSPVVSSSTSIFINKIP